MESPYYVYVVRYRFKLSGGHDIYLVSQSTDDMMKKFRELCFISNEDTMIGAEINEFPDPPEYFEYDGHDLYFEIFEAELI